MKNAPKTTLYGEYYTAEQLHVKFYRADTVNTCAVVNFDK